MPSSTIEVLERPLYSFSEAARLLRIPTTTLRRWVDGQGASAPIIRPSHTGRDAVTWGEFVEAGFLREYRREHGVSLDQLRPFVQRLRDELGVPYPLAHERPFVARETADLVVNLQDELDLPEPLFVVAVGPRAGQLTIPALAFIDKVDFDADIAIRMRPEGGGSPVVIDPAVSFGIPTIRGVRTETIAEALAAGETIEFIMRTWGLDDDEVRAAAEWERLNVAA